MYLKRLELQGFKSFANKTIIDFEKGITGVVGPNGSGKSNISDSIRWVLGEQSAKSLRGSKMEDIIFAGTTNRRALGFAEITLVLDNKDGAMAIDYTEVSVTRRVFRSGESEYYINKTSCRLKDIKELFMDTGIGIDGYSIIGQGKIDSILSTKSDDRRAVFEEAAGIVKYKSRKNDAEKKLEKTEQNLVRINDIIHELESQIEPLKQQSIKAKEYLEISECLKNHEINICIHEIEKLNQQISIFNNQSKETSNLLNNKQSIKNNIEENYKEIKEKIDEIDINIENHQELKFKIKNDLERKVGELNLNYERIKHLNEERDRIKKDIEETNKHQEKLSIEGLNINEHTNSLNNTIQKLEKEYDLKNSLKTKLFKALEDFEENIENNKIEIVKILNDITEKKSKINTINDFNKNVEKRIQQLDEDINNYNKLYDEKITQIKSTNNALSIIKDKINSLDTDKKHLVLKHNNLIKSEAEIVKKISDFKSEIQVKISNRNLMITMKNDYEGYYRSVKNALDFCKKKNVLGRGVRGVVGELIQVKKEYELAIEYALGSSLQNIVTESEHEAKEVIKYLKNNKLGRVTFLPITTISGRKLSQHEEKILNFEGVIGVASKLIKTEQDYKNIIDFLLGRVIVVDNLDTGIKVAKFSKNNLKIITLQGEILNPGGSITGGSIKKNITNLLSRDRNINELNCDIKELKDKYSIKNNELETIKKEIKDLIENIASTENSLNELKLSMAKNESILNNYTNEKTNTEKIKEKTKFEKDQLLSENQYSFKNIDALKKEVQQLQNKNESINEKVKLNLTEFDKCKLEKELIENELTEIRINIASTSQEIKSLNSTIEKYNEDKVMLVENIKSKQIEYTKKEQDIKNLLIDKDNINKLKQNLLSKLNDVENELSLLKNEKEDFVNNFKEEEIKLKNINNMVDGYHKEINTIEVKLAKYTLQLENFNNKLWEDYQLSYKMALNYKSEIKNLNKVLKEVKLLKNKIRMLGNINIDSINEYDNVLERYNFMKEQIEDLFSAKESLQKVIKDMESKMKDQFLRNFYNIKKNFNEIFNTLFNGGKADVILEDDENILTSGIEIIAQPPGKKLQNISLLSGGEKALTAIALLFSILKLKPTPFCVLDEIEAALDDANVYRFADYLQGFAQKTQFIVITHRKGTMESVDMLYGVTMEEEGISKIVSVKLKDNTADIYTENAV